MVKRIVIAVVLVGLLLAPTPQADAGRCHLGGSGRKTICLCPNAEGRFKSAPMVLCGKRR